MGLNGSLLIVEDDPAVTLFCRRALERASYRVFAASGVREAIRWLSENPGPDFVLSDVNMTPLEGWALVEWVKANRPRCPVGMMTGKPSDDVQRAAQRTGAAGVLNKPFAADALLRFVETHRRPPPP